MRVPVSERRRFVKTPVILSLALLLFCYQNCDKFSSYSPEGQNSATGASSTNSEVPSPEYPSVPEPLDKTAALLNQGFSFFITFDQSVAGFIAGEPYIIRRFRADKSDVIAWVKKYRMIVTSISTQAINDFNLGNLNLKIYTNSATGQACLVDKSTSKCVAQFRASLFGAAGKNPSVRELVFQKYFDQTAATLASGVPSIISSLNSTDSTALSGAASNAADWLGIGAELVPFVADPKIRIKLADGLDQIAQALFVSFNPAIEDMILTTNTGPLGTIARLSRALIPVYQLKPSYSTQLTNYTTTIGTRAMQVIINAWVSLGLTNELSNPTGFTLTPTFAAFFLPTANLVVGTGGPSVYSSYEFFEPQFGKLFEFQNLTSASCYDTKFAPTYVTVAYGGFPHLGNSCLQDLAHTNGYIGALHSTGQVLESYCLSQPQSFLSWACSDIWNRTLAALAWNNSLTATSGGLLLAVPSSIVGNDQVSDTSPQPVWSSFGLYHIFGLIDFTQKYFESSQVKVDFDGRTKSFKSIREDAYRTVDYVVRDWEPRANSPLPWLPWFWGQFIKAEAHRNGLVF